MIPWCCNGNRLVSTLFFHAAGNVCKTNNERRTTMPKTKLNIIKPALGVTQMPDGDLLARLNAVHEGMLNNPAYPTTHLSIWRLSRAPSLPLRLLPPAVSLEGH